MKMVENGNDPVDKYCFKMMQNPQIRVSTAVVNDVLAELAEMCCVFQRSFITPLEAFEFGKLRAPYLGHTAHFSSKVTILASIGNEVNNDAVLPFSERVCNNLGDQLPDGELKEGVAFEISAL
jgi:hypothetical protein